MVNNHLFWIFCLGLLLPVLTGCGGGIQRVSIEGHVTYQGEPLEGGEITFRPEAGPGCGAEIDANGNFKVDKSWGPMPGTCQIVVEKMIERQVRGSDGRTSIEKFSVLPDKYRNAPKTLTLTKGHNKIEIDLDKWD